MNVTLKEIQIIADKMKTESEEKRRKYMEWEKKWGHGTANISEIANASEKEIDSSHNNWLRGINDLINRIKERESNE